MQENKERLQDNDELVENENEQISDVIANQESLFDNDEVFTEAMVVEKEEITVDSSANTTETKKDEKGDTAIFSFAKEKPKGSEIGHEELTVSDIESSAKEYYNATHAEDIADKVQELYNRANSTFGEDTPAAQPEVFEEQNFDDSLDETAVVQYSKKDKKKNKKKKKRGHVSDDDMELLSGNGDGATLHQQVSTESFNETSVDEAAVDAQAEVIEDAVTEQVPVDSQQGALDVVSEMEQTSQEDADDTEKKLFEALGTQDEDTEQYMKKYEDMYTEDEVEFEYTSKEQENSILINLRKNAMRGMLSVFLTLVATMACIYFETAAVTSLPSPAIFEAGKFGVTYAMCMLQIMFLCVIFNLDGVKRAFKGLRPSKASYEGFTAAICIVCTVHSVASSLLAGNSDSLRSYCSVGCAALFFLSLNSFFKAQTTLSAFCVAASKKPKFSCKILQGVSEESESFANYLDEDSEIVTVEKSSFVEGFFAKAQAVPMVAKHSFKRICIVEALAVVAGVAAGILASDVYAGFTAFATVSLMSLPVNALIVTALPFFKATSKAMEFQTAFIGEAVCDTYDDVNVISFDDTEVFPPRGVKVSSIKTYENNRIDKVILYMARIFDVVKGPLSYVFANSVHNMEENECVAEVKEFFPNGVRAEVDGKSILVGQAEFMLMNGMTPVEDNIDETFVNSSGSIIYMAIDGVLSAKFYVKYAINSEFEKMLRSFYDAGVCVGIKTLDPCITTELVTGFLRGSNYPVAVISKSSEGMEMMNVSDKTESSIISLTGVHSFLKGFIKADKLRNIYRAGSAFSVVSIIAGFLLSTLGVLFLEGGIGVLFMIVFQIIWCLPQILISAFSK